MRFWIFQVSLGQSVGCGIPRTVGIKVIVVYVEIFLLYIKMDT